MNSAGQVFIEFVLLPPGSLAAAAAEDKYQISTRAPGGIITPLARDLTLQQVKDKFWKSNKPVELLYSPLDKRKEGP